MKNMRFSKETIKNICEDLIEKLFITPALKTILTDFKNILYDELEQIENDYCVDERNFHNSMQGE